jgi:hypothetical protein
MKQIQSEIDEEEIAFRKELKNLIANKGVASSLEESSARKNLQITYHYDSRDPYFRQAPKNKNTRFDLQGAINDSIEKCRKDYEGGDKSAAMKAIYTSLMYGMLPPEWASNYFVNAYATGISTFKAESWHEVLGRPYPKKMKLHAARRRQKLIHSVWLAVRQEYQNSTKITRKGGTKSVSLNDAFLRVGKKFHIERTTVSSYYYEYEKFISGI